MCRNCNPQPASVSAAELSAASQSQPGRQSTRQFTLGAIVGMEPIVPSVLDRFVCTYCAEETAGDDKHTNAAGNDYCECCYDADYFVCSKCNKEGDRGDEKDSEDGNTYCEECYDEDYATCERCDCEVSRDDSHRSDGGDDYCDECYYEIYTRCEGCGEEVYCDDSHYSEEDSACYCQSCYDDRFTTCAGRRCDCTVRTENAHCVDGSHYCDECYSENFTECESCGETINCDNSYYCERFEETYCESCFPGSECDNEECEENGECGCDAPRAGRRNRNRPQPAASQPAAGCKHWQSARFNPADNSTVTTGTDRTFAIEVETATCPNHRDFNGKYSFNCEPDGSINGEEFPSAVLNGDAGLAAITAFLDAANSAGWTVDSKCGTHAHFGVGDLSVDQLKCIAYAYLLTRDAWTSFVSKSRRENYYCGAIQWTFADIDAIKTLEDFINFSKHWGDENRYQWINWGAYTKTKGCGTYRKTMECRLHAGTTDPVKINNWVVCHLRFITAVAKMTMAGVERKFAGKSGYEQFMALASIWDDKGLSDYMADRAAKFGTTYTTSTRRSTRVIVKA